MPTAEGCADSKDHQDPVGCVQLCLSRFLGEPSFSENSGNFSLVLSNREILE